MVYLVIKFKKCTSDEYKIERLSKLDLVEVDGYTGPKQFMFWPSMLNATIVSILKEDEVKYSRAIQLIPLVSSVVKSELLTDMSEID